MRTESTRGARRWLDPLLRLSYWKYLNILLSPVSYPATTKRSACPIHPPDRLEKMRVLLH
jgi:hypothetical protein